MLAGASAGWMVLGGAAFAQTAPPEPATEAEPAVPSIGAVRVETAPVIDGRLDDEVWGAATPSGSFGQVVPVEGGEPSERTELRVLYDRTTLYIGVRCFDRSPGELRATQMRRDVNQGSDDRVRIVLDPYFDRRNGFFFDLNPVGARTDGLIENGGRNLRTEWDGIWYGDGSIDDEGWSAEFAIPFQTLSFDPEAPAWGFNVERVIRRRTETVRFAAVTQNAGVTQLALAGRLFGIEDVKRGLGVDVVPFVAFRGIFDRDEPENDDLDWEAGGDLFFRLTPTLRGAITVNTDFAEVEVDERQINLTRFPLFFPERRDFFLQDAGIFSFGDVRVNPLAFQSRRIGIGPDGERRDIRIGGKLTGRVGPMTLGILNVEMENDDELGSKNLGVARVAYDVLEESSVGAIVTTGDPDSPNDAWLWGTDFLFRKSDVFGDKLLRGSAFFQQSRTEGEHDDDWTWGFKLSYPNDRIRLSVDFTEIRENFDAALGFVPRRGIREYIAGGGYRWRPGGAIRRIDTSSFVEVITDLDDEIQTEDFQFTPIEVELESNDTFFTEVSLQREVLDEDFLIAGEVNIPIGDYRFERFGGGFRTSNARPFDLEARLEGGTFFDGHRVDTTLELGWRPSRYFNASAEYQQSDVDLDGGDFTTRISRLRADLLVNPDISWSTFVQYDNFTDSIGVNSRIRWIIEPGNDLFVVVNSVVEAEHRSLHYAETDVVTKAGWTFRF